MGRWLLRGIGALLILGAVVRGGGALNLWQVPDFSGRSKQSTSKCVEGGMRGYEKGIALSAGISPAQIDPVSSARITNAVKALCRDPEARARRVSLPKLFRANPAAYEQLCLAGIDMGLAARPDEFVFSSTAERNRLRREQCRLILETMDEDHPSGNWSRMFALHPDFFVLACGAAVHAELARDAANRREFGAGALHRISRRSCSEGLHRGVIDTSHSRGLRDFRTNGRVWTELIVQVAREEGRA